MRFDLVNIVGIVCVLTLTFYAGGEFREYQLRAKAQAFVSAFVENVNK